MGASSGTSVYFYTNSFVREVIMSVTNACCDNLCGPSTSTNFHKAVTVNLYGGLQSNCRSYLGSVLYGHLTSATATSRVLTTSDYSNGIKVRNVTSGTCTGCYGGAHTHTECKYGSLMVAYPNAITAGSTVIYQYSVPSTCYY